MIWSLAAGFKRPNFSHRAAPESKVARRAQLCASHWVQGSPLPPAAQAIILRGSVCAVEARRASRHAVPSGASERPPTIRSRAGHCGVED